MNLKLPFLLNSFRPLLQLILLGVFMWQFGIPAVEKYLLGKEMVVRTVRRSEGIVPPSVTVFAGNVEAWSPWRGNLSGDVSKVCGEEEEVNISTCIDEKGYTFSEVIKDVVIGLKQPVSLTLKHLWPLCHMMDN